MKPSIWPENLNHIWAKSADKGVLGQPETLAQHTWNVLVQMADLQRLRPEIPAALGQPGFWNILFWATFLHDFGKTLPGFQAVLRNGPRWPERHEVFSLAFLDWIDHGLSETEQDWITSAIVSHHKEADDVLATYLREGDSDTIDYFNEMLETISDETIHGLWNWLAHIAPVWQRDLDLDGCTAYSIQPWDEQTALARLRQEGGLAISHRLARYQAFLEAMHHTPNRGLVLTGLLLRGHLVNADHSASAHVDRLPPFPISEDGALERVQNRLYEHQRRAWESEGSALLIAPTGSGKTEAALLWAARQAATRPDGLPRLFYTLPYQTSMNAMLGRLRSVYNTERIGLQHGRGLLANYRLLMERNYTSQEAVRMAKLARNLAELNQFPIRVFSPYQMLKGTYRLKGYEALLMDYYGAAFIFDEIHAYEPGRLAMIFKLIEFLRVNYGARFFIMSATFPRLIRERLTKALDGPVEITATADLYADFRRHRLHMEDGDLLDHLVKIETDAWTGKSVLVVCNRVDRAQTAYRELYDRLYPAGIKVELLHGRFNMHDRSTKERLIRDCTGARSQNPRPLVLVATQAVEVSLDIDLDTIYTDPAPLEALVQRFGRINRARKQPDLALVHVFRKPDDGQKVYDASLVQRTMALLEREQNHPIDEAQIGTWVDEIYQGEVAEQWQKEYDTAAADFSRACLQTLVPFEASEELEKVFYAAFDSVEVLPENQYELFIQLQKENPILADELLVPIRYGRYCALANKGMLFPLDKQLPPIVRCHYDSEVGLDFEILNNPEMED